MVTAALAQPVIIMVDTPRSVGDQVLEQVALIYDEEVSRAHRVNNHTQSIYQLRGEAQKRAQELFEQAASIHNIPVYELPAIRWNLRDNRAGAATRCTDADDGVYHIALNELLFLYNYAEFMQQTIPHEVAHIIQCLKYPREYFDASYDAHGEEWAQAMVSFGNSPDIYHTMDTTPIAVYNMRVDVFLMTFRLEHGGFILLTR